MHDSLVAGAAEIAEREEADGRTGDLRQCQRCDPQTSVFDFWFLNRAVEISMTAWRTFLDHHALARVTSIRLTDRASVHPSFLAGLPGPLGCLECLTWCSGGTPKTWVVKDSTYCSKGRARLHLHVPLAAEPG